MPISSTSSAQTLVQGLLLDMAFRALDPKAVVQLLAGSPPLRMHDPDPRVQGWIDAGGEAETLINTALEHNAWNVVISLVSLGCHTCYDAGNDREHAPLDETRSPNATVAQALVTAGLPSKITSIEQILRISHWSDADRANRVRQALTQGMRIPQGPLLLIEMASQGLTACVCALMDAGADLHASTNKEFTLYPPQPSRPAANSQAPVRGILPLRVPAAVFTMHHGYTALHAAVYEGHTETAKTLLRYGADLHRTTDEGASLFHLAAHTDRDPNLLPWLEAQGLVPDGQAPSPLHWAPHDRAAHAWLLAYEARTQKRSAPT